MTLLGFVKTQGEIGGSKQVKVVMLLFLWMHCEVVKTQHVSVAHIQNILCTNFFLTTKLKKSQTCQ